MKGGRKLAVALFLAALAAGLFLFFRSQAPSLSAAMNDEPLRLPLQAPRVVIRKSARELTLYDGARPVRRYRVVLGASAEGDKQREGDRRTPEGEFYTCTRNGTSRFHKFMGISYPGPTDAERGLRSQLISQSEHDAILQAHRQKQCPPWKTKLGGEVGLHGGGTDRDWTLGCIALTNEAIDELWAALPLGSPLLIVR